MTEIDGNTVCDICADFVEVCVKELIHFAFVMCEIVIDYVGLPSV